MGRRETPAPKAPREPVAVVADEDNEDEVVEELDIFAQPFSISSATLSYIWAHMAVTKANMRS